MAKANGVDGGVRVIGSTEMASAVAWDEGVRWRSVRTVEPTRLPMPVDDLRRILRVANGTAEDDELEAWLWAAVRDCEGYGRQGMPQRAIMPQTWQVVLSSFPLLSQRIVLPVAPVLSVTSVSYYDSGGAIQDLASASPVAFSLIPSGQWAAAEIRPLPGEFFPYTQPFREDAVTVTFTAGYSADGNSPALKHVKAGLGLFVGEMYRQRSVSIDARLTPSVLTLERFWGGPF